MLLKILTSKLTQNRIFMLQFTAMIKTELCVKCGNFEGMEIHTVGNMCVTTLCNYTFITYPRLSIQIWAFKVKNVSCP
jgi:hypothetical protein